jgi:polysaccharide biosynthesis/export protein VpsN
MIRGRSRQVMSLVWGVSVAALLAGAAGCQSPGARSSRGSPAPGAYAPDDRKPTMMAPAPTPAARPGGAVATALDLKPASAPASPTLKAAPRTVFGAKEYTPYRLRPGDPIVVTLRGIAGVPGGQQQIEGSVNENGEINLPFIDFVHAAGRTGSELEQDIQRAYIDQQIYRQITVNVTVPSRVYYVRGEVRQPGRFPILSGVTIVQAIAAAGGFTEFASPSKVEIVRGTDRIRVNVDEMEKRPEKDREVEPGDVIIVPRSFL